MAKKRIQTWKKLSQKKVKPNKKLKQEIEAPPEAVYSQAELEHETKGVSEHRQSPADQGQQGHKTHKVPPRALRVRWIMGVILVGAFVSFITGWLMFGIDQTAPGGVDFTVTSRDMVTPGGEAEVVIVLKNNERSSVTNAELKIRWPSGVRVISANPQAENQSQNTWYIEQLGSQETVEIVVMVQLFGEEGDQKNINATLVYELDNFSSDFFVDAAHTIAIGNAILDVKFDDIVEVQPLQLEQWRIAIVNQSAETLENKLFEVLVPTEFIDISAQPSAVIEAGDENTKRVIFALDELGPEEEFVIKLEGQFDAGSQGRQALVWRFGEYIDAGFEVLQEGEHIVFVTGDEVEVEVLLNNKESLETLEWGDVVTFTLIARNITGGDVYNATWELETPAELFNWNTLTTPNTHIQERPGLIRFVPSANATLQTIAAGQSAQVQFSVALAGTSQNISELLATARLELSTDIEGEDVISFTKEAERVPINNLVTWHSSAHYFSDEGVAIGSGPTTPTVGQASQYQIQWAVSEISDAGRFVISTQLPDNVFWPNSFSVNAGNLTYTPGSRRVTWTVQNPSAVLVDGELSATWDVGVIPSANQVDDILPLTGTVQLDVTKQQVISQTKPALSTALEGDLYAVSDGRVKEN